MKTKSGRDIGVFYPNAFIEILTDYAKASGKGLSWHIRQACIEYLERKGVDVSNIKNPEGRGERSDLRKIPQATFDKVKQKAKTRTKQKSTHESGQICKRK